VFLQHFLAVPLRKPPNVLIPLLPLLGWQSFQIPVFPPKTLFGESSIFFFFKLSALSDVTLRPFGFSNHPPPPMGRCNFTTDVRLATLCWTIPPHIRSYASLDLFWYLCSCEHCAGVSPSFTVCPLLAFCLDLPFRLILLLPLSAGPPQPSLIKPSYNFHDSVFPLLFLLTFTHLSPSPFFVALRYASTQTTGAVFCGVMIVFCPSFSVRFPKPYYHTFTFPRCSRFFPRAISAIDCASPFTPPNPFWNRYRILGTI